MAGTKVVAVLCLSLTLLAPLARAQKPTWNDATFDTSIDRRNDWCEIMGKVYNGTVALRDALRGKKLSISMPNPATYSPAGFVNVDAEGSILQGKEGGFIVEILDELARRAGCTWRESYATFDEPEKFDKSWTDLLVRAYDMSGEWWMPTVARRALGVSFLQGFWESSLILVQKSKGVVEPTFGERLTTWSGPLEPVVWGMCVAAALVVGMAYWFLENNEDGSDLDRDSAAQNGIASFFVSLLLFTGGGGPAPRTFAGHFLLVGWSLFVLVVINGYAANLVAFLVKKGPPAFVMTDIEDGYSRQLTFCVWVSAYPGPLMKVLYPNMKVVAGTNGNLVKKLDAGECDAAVMVKDSFAVQARLKDYNEDCDKIKTGDTIYPGSAGFAVAADAGIKCTGIIRETLDIHMVEMEIEGFISEVKQRWMDLPTTTNHTCEGKSNSDKEVSDTTPLGLDRFEGIFIILAVVTFVALVWGLASKAIAARAAKIDPAANPEEEAEHGKDNGEPIAHLVIPTNGKSGAITKDTSGDTAILEMIKDMRAEMAEMKVLMQASQLASEADPGVRKLKKKAKSSADGPDVQVLEAEPNSMVHQWVGPDVQALEAEPRLANAGEGGFLQTLTFGGLRDDMIFRR